RATRGRSDATPGSWPRRAGASAPSTSSTSSRTRPTSRWSRVGFAASEAPGAHFPAVEPVSFAVVEGELVVAVRAGSAGDAVAAGTVVAFEVDVLDRRLRQGWSVVVSGAVEDLDAEVAELVRPLVSPWPAAPGDRLFLVRSEQVSGQQVVTAAE